MHRLGWSFAEENKREKTQIPTTPVSPARAQQHDRHNQESMTPSQSQRQRGLGPPQLRLRSVRPPLRLALCSLVDPGSHFRQLLGEEKNEQQVSGSPQTRAKLLAPRGLSEVSLQQ